MTRRAVILGVGAYLPEKILTNADLEKMVATSDEWIAERTGIRSRHIAAPGEFTSDLAIRAGRAALENAKLSPDDIDVIVLATTTPDETMPSTAVKVQAGLGMTRGAAFDVNAACSGFVYALTVANALLIAGNAKRALVIGAETFSRILDWTDRGTCILFGDGAGAVVLEAQEQKGDVRTDRGILHASISSDGRHVDLLKTTGGISTTQAAGTVTMQGKEIFRHAVAKMSEAVEHSLAETGLAAADLTWIIPHQANVRILQAVAKRLEMSPDHLISTVRGHANTSAASIPLALDAAISKGRIKAGNLIAMPALGAGLTWGSCLIRW